MYEVDVEFLTTEFATLDVDADDRDQAEYEAIQRAKALYDVNGAVEIIDVREV